tara:strand:- start:3539 stop:3931 length:393 start_codon:yes stop_codon:yes gene_type:complete
MRLEEQIKKDMVSAMKERNEVARDILRVLRGELQRNFITEDVDVIKIVKKLIENIRENGDDDDGEIDVLDKYLPKQMTESQMRHVVKEVINDDAIDSMSGMGVIMTHFKNKHAGTYDGRVLSIIVKNELS